MYTIYRQIHKPTGVENSVYCNFTSPHFKVLLVSAASQLTIYKLKDKYKNVAEKDLAANYTNYEQASFDGVLEVVGKWSLFGNIVSMKSICSGKDQLDYLLLSFYNGKLSVVEFDVEAHDIKTCTIHYFEDSIEQHGLLQNTAVPRITIDPDNRCAAMMLTSFYVAIVAFQKQENASGDFQSFKSKKKKVSSYDINFKDVDPRMQRVIDIQFLHGYYEPTLLVLFESPVTWSGRVATRRDTCNIVAISLNTWEKSHPVIWALDGLPHDCMKVLAVPKPIGGVIVFANSSIIYLNQSIPSYGVSLNCTASNTTSFVLKQQNEVRAQLNGCQVEFVTSEKLLLCLNTGEIYTLGLTTDNMRSVTSFVFCKITTSVIPTSLTVMEHDYIFVGSRLGYPQLLRVFTEPKKIKEEEKCSIQESATEALSEVVNDKDDDLTAQKDEEKHEVEASKNEKTEDSPPSPKKQKVVEENEVKKEVDELFGSDDGDDNTNQRISDFRLTVCDSLVNIGPCVDSELGFPTISYEFSNQQESALDLVLLSGHGGSSSISVLQQTVKPLLITSFALPGCDDVWTVHSREENTKGTDYHSHLLISREDSTLVLETCKTEISEVETSGYTMDEPTVFVGNLSCGITLQVCTTSASLIDGLTLLCKETIELDSPIQHCSLSDPHAVLLTADGQVVLLSVNHDEDTNSFTIHCTNPSIPQSPCITSVCIYGDRSGMFTTYDTKMEQISNGPDVKVAAGAASSKGDDNNKNSAAVKNDFNWNESMTVDDEDQLLYGDNEDSANISQEDQREEDTKEQQQEERSTSAEKNEKTFWLVVIRQRIHLEIFDMRDQSLVFAVPNFAYGRQILIDRSANYSRGEQPTSHLISSSNLDKSNKEQQGGAGDSSSKLLADENDEYNVLEACLIGLDKEGKYPYLLARQRDQVLIYQAYSFENTKDCIVNRGLKVRFSKLDHGMMTRKPTSMGDYLDPSSFRSYFRFFDNVNGYAGAFLCGAYPYWIIATSRGDLKFHAMNVDGRVSCFAMFHNINCNHGFIYFNRQGELRIGKFSPNTRYDTDWPMRRVPLDCTAHYVVYSIEHKVYAVVTSKLEPCKRLPFLNTDNTRDFEEIEREKDFIYPNIDSFQLQLFNPSTWQCVPNTSIQMEDFEHVTCMKNVWLTPSAHTTIKNNYIAIGTSYVMGEEMCSRGRLIIVEVIEVVPEPGKPLTKNRFKTMYAEEQRGPVSALCGLGGHLLAAIGQKVFIWKFDSDGSLRGLAFVDTNAYITQALTFKNYALVGDIQRSVTLLQYQEEFKTLAVVSRDIKPMEVFAAEFLIDGNLNAFVAADADKNLSLFMHDPQALESHGGSRLVKRGDIHVGQHIGCMWRIGTVQLDRGTGLTNDSYSLAHITMMATLDGGISMLVPVTEKLYRRLTMLQNYLYTSATHTAGLNPKGFRVLKTRTKTLSNPLKNILDGDLLWRYHALTKVAKNELARKIGSTTDQLAEDFMELHRSTCVI